MSGLQTRSGAGRELDRSGHVYLNTLAETCRESLNLVEVLDQLVVADVSPLPA